jgi:membrane-associated phospholipid phosphatase
MESLYELEITILLFLQSLGAWMAGPLQAVSMLGNEEFYMLVMPTIYWSLDAALGIRMAMMLIITNGLSAFGKVVFHLPRPYWIDTRIIPLSAETSFGMPSGHAMNAAGLWGLLVAWIRSPWAKIAGVVLIFLIGFSRMYLGMHFISDVLAGWLIGGLTLYLFLRFDAPVAAWLSACSLQKKIILALASSLGIIALIWFGQIFAGSWTVPEIWEQNALRQEGGEPISPFHLDTAFTLAGTWFGMLAGAAWYQHRRGGYRADGTPAQRLLRYLVGLVGILVFWFGLGQILPREADLLSYLLRYLRYTLIGVWISVLAPLLFERLHLNAKRPQPVPALSSD